MPNLEYEYSSEAAKFIKDNKDNKELMLILKNILKDIDNNPLVGIPFTNHKKCFKIKFNYQNVPYRILYKFLDKKVTIYMFFIRKRKDAYKQIPDTSKIL